MANETKHVVVWCFTDGKPGHENQSRGLLEALSELVDLDVHWLKPLSALQAIGTCVRSQLPGDGDRPDPVLIIGAGHATHLSVLAAGRTCGGKTVVMMKPSLPCSLFDLCVVPEHDDVKASVRVLVTRGVLNRIRPTPDKDPYRGLILLGGPSKHYRWDDTTLLVQLREITSETRIHWTLATSRRTPDSMLQLLREDLPEVVDIVPWQETDKDWLPRQLDQAFRVWISEDSVSMVYEAMTSGAHCGLLEVPLRRSSRVRRGLQKLIDSSRIVTFSQWETTGRLGDVWEGPSEAQRVAQWLAEEWGLTNHG